MVEISRSAGPGGPVIFLPVIDRWTQPFINFKNIYSCPVVTSVNSVRFQWNHLMYKDTFCCMQPRLPFSNHTPGTSHTRFGQASKWHFPLIGTPWTFGDNFSHAHEYTSFFQCGCIGEKVNNSNCKLSMVRPQFLLRPLQTI
jgi:hypothetical protein